MGGESADLPPILFPPAPDIPAGSACGEKAGDRLLHRNPVMSELAAALETAIRAAREAGALLRREFGRPAEVDEFHAHDIKLALDVKSQELITGILLDRFPLHALYGEEGIAGESGSEWQWIVDPIDGTVNYFYGLPHYCISIALRLGEEMQLGVIYDPSRDELWQTVNGSPALLNGRTIRVSERSTLGDAIVSIGFSKSKATINAGLQLLPRYVESVRKCRLMGSAALDLAYVATGRLDAYIEQSVSLWDVAAGKMLVENAGGRVEMTPRADNPDKLSVRAWNGRLQLLAES
jgi:myo-inositol-1(or 4)-monophosphatase